jgi:hypothetical protein
MANTKISELPIATDLQGSELFPIVQSGVTKQTTLDDLHNYIIPTNLEIVKDTIVNLSDAEYQKAEMIRLTWSGDSGDMTLNLPSASDNQNRIMRFISNGGYATATRTNLTPIGGDTLDGTTSAYVINKAYEGIQIWSDGVQWFIIQKKA